MMILFDLDGQLSVKPFCLLNVSNRFHTGKENFWNKLKSLNLHERFKVHLWCTAFRSLPWILAEDGLFLFVSLGMMKVYILLKIVLPLT